MNKKSYAPPRIIQYVPDQLPKTLIQLFRDDLPTGGSHRLEPANVVDSVVSAKLNSPVKKDG